MKRFNGPGNQAGRFVERNPSTGQSGSRPDASWLNNIQEEFCSVVTEDGVALNPTLKNQLSTQIHTRKKAIYEACRIPTPDVYLPLTGDLRMVFGKSTAIEVTDNAGTPVNTPIIGAKYTMATPVYEIDEYLNAVYPVNVARYTPRGIKLTRATTNFFTRSWDMVNYVRSTNPNLREPTVRTMFGRTGTRFTKTATDFMYLLGVYGRKIVTADKEHTYTICYNLDFAAENKIRYMRSRLAYVNNWAQTAQIEVDLIEGRVINSKAIRYEETRVDNFLIVSATGKSSLTPETTGGGSVDIIPLYEPLQVEEDPTVTGVAEVMWVQLEEASSWAGYVETNGQEATRTSDSLTIDGKNFEVNSSSGGITFKCKFSLKTFNLTSSQYLCEIGSGSSRLAVYFNSQSICVSNGSSNISKLLEPEKIKSENTLVITISRGKVVNFVLNGEFSTIGSIPFSYANITDTSIMRIGMGIGNSAKNSIYIRDWTWWNTAFTKEQLLGACK